MQKRKLRIVKDSPPFIGICEHCNAQFKGDKLRAVFSAFDAHKCELKDASQAAARIVREATEGH